MHLFKTDTTKTDTTKTEPTNIRGIYEFGYLNAKRPQTVNSSGIKSNSEKQPYFIYAILEKLKVINIDKYAVNDSISTQWKNAAFRKIGKMGFNNKKKTVTKVDATVDAPNNGAATQPYKLDPILLATQLHNAFKLMQKEHFVHLNINPKTIGIGYDDQAKIYGFSNSNGIDPGIDPNLLINTINGFLKENPNLYDSTYLPIYQSSNKKEYYLRSSLKINDKKETTNEVNTCSKLYAYSITDAYSIAAVLLKVFFNTNHLQNDEMKSFMQNVLDSNIDLIKWKKNDYLTKISSNYIEFIKKLLNCSNPKSIVELVVPISGGKNRSRKLERRITRNLKIKKRKSVNKRRQSSLVKSRRISR